MKKLVGIFVMFALFAPSMAKAVDPPRHNGPERIIGTRHDDTLRGGRGPDIIKGLGGDDVIWTGKGGPGDKAYGGTGNDRLHNWASGNSPGLLNGGPGRDKCVGDFHDTFRNCEVIRYR